MLTSAILAFALAVVDASSLKTGTCVFDNDGTKRYMAIGETWNSTDLCVRYICQESDHGEPSLKMFRENCYLSCNNDYQLIVPEGQCCGECIQTKCKSGNGAVHDIGQMWRSEDSCTFYECIQQNGHPTVTSYQKSCPPIGNCPKEQIEIQNCCAVCGKANDQRSSSAVSNEHFIFQEDNQNEFMDINTYLNHPCSRECVVGEPPMLCNYTFMVEWYETLSKACFDCPFNEPDCYHPNCVYGDGIRRSIVTINRMMPGPRLQICLGDTIRVDVINHLMGESTSVHWHGMHQIDTPFMDGVPMITQCPIPPHTTFRYTFTADHEGTHWWHSHSGMQRSDGALGALIVRKPREQMPPVISALYQYDLPGHTIVIQDWKHIIGVASFSSAYHSIGDNKPKNILINGRGKYVDPKVMLSVKTHDPRSRFERTPLLTPFEIFNVIAGNSYRFRTINGGFLMCPFEISIDDHNITVISSDGGYFEPVVVSTLVTYAGERFDFVVKADRPVGNYWVRVRGLLNCDERFTKAHQVAILRYNGASDSEPSEETPTWDFNREGLQMNAVNRGSGLVESVSIAELTTLESYDDPKLMQEFPDITFYVYYDFYQNEDPHFKVPSVYNNAYMNNTKQDIGSQLNRIAMKMPSSPLFTDRNSLDDSKFCNESSLAQRNIDCKVEYCECIHVLQVPLNAVVEMMLVDEGYKYDANHVLHLHGHAFKVVAMERLNPNGIDVDEVQALDKAGLIKRRLRGAPSKDTITVPDGGYTIIRFVANNPGYWLFHCHNEYHMEVGMSLVIKVGEHEQMRPIPKDFPTCSNYLS